MNRQNFGLALLGIGFLYVILMGIVVGVNLNAALRTHTFAEIQGTVWALDKPLFILWAFSIPMGALAAVFGALIHGGIGRVYIALTGLGYVCVVFVMTVLFTRFYMPILFGIGGVLSLGFFFTIVWLWMRKFETLAGQERIAAVFQLIGYLFFITASWFLCGEFSSMRLKAFEGRPPPSPIEIAVFLVLGWLFLFLGHYTSRSKP